MKKFIIVLITLSTFIFAKDKSTADYIKDLSSKKSNEVIAACNYMGKKKVDKSIAKLIDLLQNHENVSVKIASASALGSQKKERPKIIQALRSSIENEDSNEVIYTALLALGNVAEKDNKDALAALKFCEENKADDLFIKDMVNKVKNIISPAKKKKAGKVDKTTKKKETK